jgi:hypothetical protein
MAEAEGRFDVDMKPAESFGAGIGRFSVTKTFFGEMTGSGVGEMLALRTATPGSAGYVLMERVTVQLAGRSGSFVLQHHGIMKRGQPALTVTVVPDSGTGALAGIVGEMTIDATDHSYKFRYEVVDEV